MDVDRLGFGIVASSAWAAAPVPKESDDPPPNCNVPAGPIQPGLINRDLDGSQT